ncbi:MAG: TonB C-terminal domain-containing protein [Myxococcales bacterium]|nr:TonB C-terminal domain-containing protein [Myxococcales bacterium]
MHTAPRLRMGAPGSIFKTGQPLDPLVVAASAAALPGLSMPEPEDRRRILISSAASALLHILIITSIALLGTIAKQAAEKLIPVVILNEPIELPGSNDPSPLPIPKLLSAPMASVVPPAMEPVNLAAVPAPRIEATSLDLVAPKSLDLTEVMNAPLAPQAEIHATPSAADISAIQPLEIAAADLVAPEVEISGPSAVAIRTATDLVAPHAFDTLSELNATHYKGAATAVPTAIAGSETGGTTIATGISAEYLAAGFAGGDPNAVATISCLQSAFVQRYLDEITRRTYARWEPPLDASPDDVVQFRIAIDQSGSIAKLEMIESTSRPFAESAMIAYRNAAPFPPLNDKNRCLTEKIFRLTFSNPEVP